MLDRAPEATGRRICFRLCPRPESTEVGDEAFEYALTAGDIVLPAFAGTASGKEEREVERPAAPMRLSDTVALG